MDVESSKTKQQNIIDAWKNPNTRRNVCQKYDTDELNHARIREIFKRRKERILKQLCPNETSPKARQESVSSIDESSEGKSNCSELEFSEDNRSLTPSPTLGHSRTNSGKSLRRRTSFKRRNKVAPGGKEENDEDPGGSTRPDQWATVVQVTLADKLLLKRGRKLESTASYHSALNIPPRQVSSVSSSSGSYLSAQDDKRDHYDNTNQVAADNVVIMHRHNGSRQTLPDIHSNRYSTRPSYYKYDQDRSNTSVTARSDPVRYDHSTAHRPRPLLRADTRRSISDTLRRARITSFGHDDDRSESSKLISGPPSPKRFLATPQSVQGGKRQESVSEESFSESTDSEDESGRITDHKVVTTAGTAGIPGAVYSSQGNVHSRKVITVNRTSPRQQTRKSEKIRREEKSNIQAEYTAKDDKKKSKKRHKSEEREFVASTTVETSRNVQKKKTEKKQKETNTKSDSVVDIDIAAEEPVTAKENKTVAVAVVAKTDHSKAPTPEHKTKKTKADQKVSASVQNSSTSKEVTSEKNDSKKEKKKKEKKTESVDTNSKIVVAAEVPSVAKKQEKATKEASVKVDHSKAPEQKCKNMDTEVNVSLDATRSESGSKKSSKDQKDTRKKDKSSKNDVRKEAGIEVTAGADIKGTEKSSSKETEKKGKEENKQAESQSQAEKFGVDINVNASGAQASKQQNSTKTDEGQRKKESKSARNESVRNADKKNESAASQNSNEKIKNADKKNESAASHKSNDKIKNADNKKDAGAGARSTEKMVPSLSINADVQPKVNKVSWNSDDESDQSQSEESPRSDRDAPQDKADINLSVDVDKSQSENDSDSVAENVNDPEEITPGLEMPDTNDSKDSKPEEIKPGPELPITNDSKDPKPEDAPEKESVKATGLSVNVNSDANINQKETQKDSQQSDTSSKEPADNEDPSADGGNDSSPPEMSQPENKGSDEKPETYDVELSADVSDLCNNETPSADETGDVKDAPQSDNSSENPSENSTANDDGDTEAEPDASNNKKKDQHKLQFNLKSSGDGQEKLIAKLEKRLDKNLASLQGASNDDGDDDGDDDSDIDENDMDGLLNGDFSKELDTFLTKN